MKLEDLVRFLKYEADLATFFHTSANYYYHNQKLPSEIETQKIKVVLAVSDQKEGQQPKSNDPLYQQAYQIAQSI
ncbi:hypothetical protein [Microcoleus sp. D2_18a_D3]|uniref:hypothetical protein n=1 Tax=Microcoleus sp. D2_18a_D3 TaxID=3055330 RepID=UPI002FD5B086